MADERLNHLEAEEEVIEDPGEKVHVWPHLVSIEMVGALIYLFALIVISILIKAPLGQLANPELTPNPSKAPWYFLGLQELLLHMHPALAGVIVPTAALVLLGAIPYIDRTRAGTGVWFYSPKGVPIAVFSAIYTTVWNLSLVLIDEYLPAGGGAYGVAPFLSNLGLPPAVGYILVPTALMIFIPWSLAIIVKRRWDADTREIMIALYSFFLASFIVLTIIGTAFRGHGMQLMWPWLIEPPIGH